MTEERIWWTWQDYCANRQMQLTKEAEAYLRGEQDEPEALFQQKGQRYLEYPAELVRELEGEQAALAARMLRVLAKSRSAGLIERYAWQRDTRLCLRIGFTIDEALDKSYRKHHTYSATETYELAELLAAYAPEGARLFAERLLERKPGEIMHDRSSDRNVYLMLGVAVRLLASGAACNAKLLPLVEACLALAGNEYIAVLLYHAHGLSPVLRERLRALLLDSITVSRTLCGGCIPAGSFADFLRGLELPPYPYYLLAASGLINVANRPRMFRQLYAEDRETFLETYRRLSVQQSHDLAVHSLGLLAILLQNGEGQRELADAHTRILAYVNLMNHYFENKTDLTKEFLLSKEPLDELAKGLKFSRYNVRYGSAQTVLPLYALLYEWEPAAKKLYSLLFASASYYENTDLLAVAYGHFVSGRSGWLGEPAHRAAERLLEDGMTRKKLFAAFCATRADSYSAVDGVTEEGTAALVKGYEAEALEYLQEGCAGGVPGEAAWLALLYGRCGIEDYGPLLDRLGSKSKQVRTRCEELIGAHEAETRAELEARAPKLKGEAAQAARRILKRWDNARLFAVEGAFDNHELVARFCEDNYNRPNEKVIKWIPEELFTGLRYADLQGEVPAIVPKYVLVEYLSLENPYRLKECDRVVERLNAADWEGLLENIYRLWLDGGADSKRKGVLVPYCVYASPPQIIRIRRQIEEWAGASRGALGAYAVGAVALGGTSMALMMVDNIAGKFPNNQVKNAARAAFAFAAKALELPEDELSDRIVPTLGFSREGEKRLDYGPRTFTVTLMPDFSLSITDDAKGKAVKSLPKAGAGDDPVKAEAAKKEFSEMKKQIKAVVQAQTGRLEKALMNGRRWTAASWTALFVENPVMHRFATGLVWCAQQDGQEPYMFRYMEDGTFNTVDEEEYELPAGAQIYLAHPAELEPDAAEAWRQQLEDYEVAQPVPQLSEPPLSLTESDLDGKLVRRFDKRPVNVGKMSSAAKKYNMVRGEVLDGGSYTCYHLVDQYLGIGAQINFEYMYMGQGYDEMAPLGMLVFYRIPENGVCDEIAENLILDPLHSVPARYVSSVLSILGRILNGGPQQDGEDA